MRLAVTVIRVIREAVVSYRLCDTVYCCQFLLAVWYGAIWYNLTCIQPGVACSKRSLLHKSWQRYLQIEMNERMQHVDIRDVWILKFWVRISPRILTKDRQVCGSMQSLVCSQSTLAVYARILIVMTCISKCRATQDTWRVENMNCIVTASNGPVLSATTMSKLIVAF